MNELVTNLGYEFKDLELLKKSFTHSSYAVENGLPSGVDNERLEFLGDAVLDLVISDLLWKEYPQEEEGPLSQRRAALVSEDCLVELARELSLADHIILGKGEKQSGGAQKPRILACAFEALIGAIYIDGNFEAAYSFVKKLFEDRVKNQGSAENYRRDFKTRLQEVYQKQFSVVPNYIVESESGPPHDRLFKVSVRAGKQVLAFGEGRSKKQAEQLAAQEALLLWNQSQEQAEIQSTTLGQAQNIEELPASSQTQTSTKSQEEKV